MKRYVSDTFTRFIKKLKTEQSSLLICTLYPVIGLTIPYIILENTQTNVVHVGEKFERFQPSRKVTFWYVVEHILWTLILMISLMLNKKHGVIYVTSYQFNYVIVDIIMGNCFMYIFVSLNDVYESLRRIELWCKECWICSVNNGIITLSLQRMCTNWDVARVWNKLAEPPQLP